LVFSTGPAALTILQVDVDTQPMDIPFYTVQTPACGNPVTFTLISPPSFLSLTNIVPFGGSASINGATMANQSTYT
jgi:hypothetical protein